MKESYLLTPPDSSVSSYKSAFCPSSSSPSLLWLLNFNVNGLFGDEEDSTTSTTIGPTSESELQPNQNTTEETNNLLLNMANNDNGSNSLGGPCFSGDQNPSGTRKSSRISKKVKLSQALYDDELSSSLNSEILQEPPAPAPARFEECSSSNNGNTTTATDFGNNKNLGNLSNGRKSTKHNHHRSTSNDENSHPPAHAPAAANATINVDEINKPRCTYTELIERALHENPDGLTVSQIYTWIANNHTYFRLEDDRWKNSVRHNLSINPYFEKRGKCKNGAGHVWTIAESCRKIVNGGGEISVPGMVPDTYSAQLTPPLNNGPGLFSSSTPSSTMNSTSASTQPLTHFNQVHFKTETERIVGGILEQYSIELNNNNNNNGKNNNKEVEQRADKDSHFSVAAEAQVTEPASELMMIVNEHEDLLITPGISSSATSCTAANVSNNGNGESTIIMSNYHEAHHHQQQPPLNLSVNSSSTNTAITYEHELTDHHHHFNLSSYDDLGYSISSHLGHVDDDGGEYSTSEKIYEFLTAPPNHHDDHGHDQHNHRRQFNEFELLTFESLETNNNICSSSNNSGNFIIIEASLADSNNRTEVETMDTTTTSAALTELREDPRHHGIFYGISKDDIINHGNDTEMLELETSTQRKSSIAEQELLTTIDYNHSNSNCPSTTTATTMLQLLVSENQHHHLIEIQPDHLFHTKELLLETVAAVTNEADNDQITTMQL